MEPGWTFETIPHPDDAERIITYLHPIFGDGLVVGPEACDDKSTNDGDCCGLDNSAFELGFYYDSYTDRTICHTIGDDAIRAGTEECDDGNNIDGDGCENNQVH